MSIHVAITRRVRPDSEDAFQHSLAEFFRASFEHHGVLGVSMIIPPPHAATREYGILRTFATVEERDAFYQSPMYREWEERAKTMTEGEAVYRDLHGLEAWFNQPDLPRPPRWKLAVATLIGVYPTSLLLSNFVGPHLHEVPKVFATLISASLMVIALTWMVMPTVTKLLHRWLHPDA